MSKLSSNWSFEPFPIQNHTCPCCDERFQLAIGVIHDEHGEDFAMYIANLTPSTKPRTVTLFVRVKNKKPKKPVEVVVSLLLRMHEGQIGTSVITDTNNPLGQAMTRKRALASPLRSLIFEIADFVVQNDPRIRLFLEEGEPTPSHEHE
jgi:hypothetical protein